MGKKQRRFCCVLDLIYRYTKFLDADTGKEGDLTDLSS